LIFSVLFCCEKEGLIPIEQLFIDTYHPFFNCSPTAKNVCGIKRSKETIQKLRKSHLGNKSRLGTSTSEEARENLRQRMLNLSVDERIKIYGNRKGKRTRIMPFKHTEESKLKMSESHKGRKTSEETKQKLREIALNMSEETKIKMSLSRIGEKSPLFGKRRSMESRKKQSETRKKKQIVPWNKKIK
jgi:hypothetical protein